MVPLAVMTDAIEAAFLHRGGNVGNVPGTGIGLHVVKQCVDLHQGTIAVDSAHGQGTTFRIELHAPAAS